MLRGTALAILLALASTVSAEARREPCPATPTTHVTDEGNYMLSKMARRDLSRRLDAYDKRTGHQVFVWIGASLSAEDAMLPIEKRLYRFGYKCINAWGIGRKGINDGVILFVFVAEDASWIETGNWAAERIPNKEAERIHREVISPLMRARRYEQAVTAGVDAILADLEAK